MTRELRKLLTEVRDAAIKSVLHRSKDMKPRPSRRMHFTVSGKAGETKSVSYTPSGDGILRDVFSAHKIIATDTSKKPGEGTIILRARSGEHWPITWEGCKTSRFAAKSLHDSCGQNRCHPLLPITFTVKFLEDCTWSAMVAGTEHRQDSQQYTTVPTVPCNRIVPVEWPKIDGGWYEGQEIDTDRRTKCECWFEYGMHASWPYKACEHFIEAVIAPGQMHDFYVPVERKSLLHRMHIPGGYDEIHSYDERSVWLNTQFRLRAFGVPGREKELKYSRDSKGPWAGFDIGCLPGALVEAGERLHIRVENVSAEEKLFKASLTGDEWVR